MNKFMYQLHKLFRTKTYQKQKKQQQTRSEDGLKIADYREPFDRIYDRSIYTDIYKKRNVRQNSYESINFDSGSQPRRSICETENIYEEIQLSPKNSSEHIYEEVQLKPKNLSEHIYEEIQLKRNDQTTITADSRKNVRSATQEPLYAKVNYANKKNRRNIARGRKSSMQHNNSEQKNQRKKSWETRQTI